MKKFISRLMTVAFAGIIISSVISSCQKSAKETAQPSNLEQPSTKSSVSNAPTPANPNFNLEAILRGEGKRFGLVKFRQDNDIDRIVTLDVWLRDMEPNHEYKLQRATDGILDGNCTGTNWLTLGIFLEPHSIFTDENGTGKQQLSRNLSAFPSGSTFDIHFRGIDAVSGNVVLNSDCYQFTSR